MKDSEYLLSIAEDIKRKFPPNGGGYSPDQKVQIKKVLDGLFELARLLILEDYLFTLNICKKALPDHTHPVHFEKIKEIEEILKKAHSCINGPSLKE